MSMILVAAVKFAHADWLMCVDALRGSTGENRAVLLRECVASSQRKHKAWANIWKHAPAYAAALHDDMYRTGRIA